MPDFVDKVFDYTFYILQGTNSVLQDGYAVSKDALQQTYDVSKSVGGTIVNGAKVVVGKVQDNVPNNLSGFSSTSPPPPPPPSTISGLLYAHAAGVISNNIGKIGLGLVFPSLGFTAYHLYRYYVPYVREAERLKGRFRYEVILVIGSMKSTFVSKLVSDLNRRGYVVFVTVQDEQELQIVEEINDTDVRALFVDFTSDISVKNSLLKLGQFLDGKIETISSESYYNFKGVLVIPDYTKLPNIKKLEELSAREYMRITETFFLKFNTLLFNGVLSFIRESNSRRDVVEGYNGQKIKGGYAKLLFVNFIVVPDNDSRRLIHNLSLNINKLFYDMLYKDISVTYKERISRILGKCNDPQLVDMTSLDVILHKNKSSTLLTDSPSLINLLSYFDKKMKPQDIHHRIFDLLNQNILFKRNKMEN